MSNLKQRNYAVLGALILFILLIFTITFLRIQEGAHRRAAEQTNLPAITTSAPANSPSDVQSTGTP